ncbi:DNA mismatch repair endonuclease MutL [Candidatus Leptofilum sp.]|uniref:DNA mismatch repair endonuclease MutL n=1 Tax=Candidatus Leptofilum sp. TaxID=3241576 RepID=UPI003B595E11
MPLWYNWGMKIQQLSDQLASQIAAGEVVERPSSVVKELVENAIDAGATSINIDVRQGGRESIQIADNGMGIATEEIETAFLRHATSKLSSIEDLNAIRTLGFRGEALAAISAVSQVTIVSRAEGADAGTRLVLEAGVVVNRERVGAPQGTVIVVENLFYNVPARLKFLKTAATEKRLIDEFVTRYALAYPQIRFRLTHNGRITFQSSGSGQVRDVLVAIYGPEIARQLLEIGDQRLEAESESSSLQSPASDSRSSIQVTGFVGSPGVHFANRGQITLFVNGRWIKDTQLTYAVIQAYHTLLPSGRYPLGLIFMQLPPEDVDVNVHPTKTEVRFRQGKAPFGTVQRAVRQTLVADAPTRQMSAWALGSNDGDSPGWMGALNPEAFIGGGGEQADLALSWLDETDSQDGMDGTLPLPEPEGETESQLPIMRVVGQVGASYIITEGPEGMFLIDQQAAHQRALFEQLQTEWAADNVTVQTLSTGTAVTLSETQAKLVEQFQEAVARVGVQFEAFGPNTFMVRAVPKIAASADPARLLISVATELEQSKGVVEEAGLVTAVCQTISLRPGQSLTLAQMEQLIRNLEKCADPFTDLHGKPTFIYLSVAQLAREFGRI